MLRKKVRITVFKRVDPKVIFDGKVPISPTGKKYEKCSFSSEGKEFIVDTDLRMPEGFCGWAWRDIYKDLSVLYFDGNFYRPEKGMAYVSCADGRKPVVFKLERIKS